MAPTEHDRHDLPRPLGEDGLAAVDAYWRATNYLGAAQLYLRDNVLLRRTLRAEDIKPRLLGHWGTQPGLNLVYAHLNRLLLDHDEARVLLVAGPGHGAPAILANLFLEGSLEDVDPSLTRDAAGARRLARRFSWPYGAPSHLVPQTPGTIQAGGELGYSLAHAFGAALDRPDLIVACVVGDGEAETGALAASWRSIDVLDPAGSGAVLPILHLNGVKLSGPTLLGRMSDGEVSALFRGQGYEPLWVAGDEPAAVHRLLAGALERAYGEIRAIQERYRGGGRRPAGPPGWPMIVLRTPKGWTCPERVDGVPVEGTARAHQIPVEDPASSPERLATLEAWLRSYRPEELFDERGRPAERVRALCPEGERRMGAVPEANGGALLRPLVVPELEPYAVDGVERGTTHARGTHRLGTLLRDLFRANDDAANFRLFCPDETTSNRLDVVFEATARAWQRSAADTDEHVAPDGRVMEVLSEHLCQGWLEGYLLTGRHGLFASYEAFVPIVDSMVNQHAKWLKQARETPWREPIASLTYLLTSHAWRQDHNGYSHQVPSFLDTVANKKGSVARIYLPPDANCLLVVAERCLRSRSLVNLIVASKQDIPQWLELEEAREHCARGAGTWRWAGTRDDDPDVILACAGDVPTEETLAAAQLLRRDVPEMRLRVVNVVDLFALASHRDHPHGLDERGFVDLFGRDRPVVFAHHGYPRLVHELVYRRPNPERFHVHGYREEGETTTPFDMLVRNGMSRYDLARAALERVPRLRSAAGDALEGYRRTLVEHGAYVREHGVDLPDVRDWRWRWSG